MLIRKYDAKKIIFIDNLSLTPDISNNFISPNVTYFDSLAEISSEF